MGDCFPKTGGNIPTSDACQLKTGSSEYAFNFKQWAKPVNGANFGPDYSDFESNASPWKKQYSFSKRARFGIPPLCDCTPPPERMRFETTYNHDFYDLLHDSCAAGRTSAFPGLKPLKPYAQPPQYLCPFTTETTYARAFDMPQSHFKPICSQQEPYTNTCGGNNSNVEQEYNPCGLTIRYQPMPKRRNVPKLIKEELIKPGSDTTSCPKCPVKIPCCPCGDERQLCEACCGCEYPCKLHQGTQTPTRKYPIVLNAPRYVPDPRSPPRRPKLLCHGGTMECPLQNQFPTQAAIAQGKKRLMEKLEQERCRFPPECIESTYRNTFKTPPLLDVPVYCSKEMMEDARKADEEYAEKGLPPKCIPPYCLDGGRPPDPRPMFDHMSSYGADFTWPTALRFKLLGGEIGESPEIKPLTYPKVIHASEVIKERTEEKERWGEDWDTVAEPQNEMNDECQ